MTAQILEFPQEHYIPLAQLGRVLRAGLEDPASVDLVGEYLDAVDLDMVPENRELFGAAFARARQLVRTYRCDPAYRDIIYGHGLLNDLLQDMLDHEAKMPLPRRRTPAGKRIGAA